MCYQKLLARELQAGRPAGRPAQHSQRARAGIPLRGGTGGARAGPGGGGGDGRVLLCPLQTRKCVVGMRFP